MAIYDKSWRFIRCPRCGERVSIPWWAEASLLPDGSIVVSGGDVAHRCPS